MSARPDSPESDTARQHAAATAHSDATPRLKRYAALYGVTQRTARRHRTPKDAKGSPLDQHFRYLDSIDDPWRVAAATMTYAKQLALKDLTNAQLIERIAELHEADALGEGEDNATRMRRGVSLLERAVATERDAAHDLELAACYREAAARGLRESDVMDQWSPR